MEILVFQVHNRKTTGYPELWFALELRRYLRASTPAMKYVDDTY